MTKYTVTINGTRFCAASLDALRDDVRVWIDGHGYGASDVGARWKVHGHPQVTHLSYNGRLWSGDVLWQEGN